MLAKTLTYEDYDGTTVTEKVYFNLTKSELLELNLRHEGGFAEYLDRIVKSNDANEIMDTFKEIIRMSYGEKDDEHHFVKSPERFERFSQTMAYDALFVELVTDTDAASAFVNAILPASVAEQSENNAGTSDPS